MEQKSLWIRSGKRYRQKVSAWEHEEEYRIVISNLLEKYQDPASRNLKYDIKSLKGIIFGIKTSEYDKEQIVKALGGIAQLLGGIKFYQARFDDEEQGITVHEKMWKYRMLTE